MNSGLFLLLMFGIIGLLAALVSIGISYVNRPVPIVSRREKELEGLVDELREIAYENRDVDANLSYLITDRIKKFNAKELS